MSSVNLFSRGVSKDETFNNLRVSNSLTAPSIDISGSTSTKPVLPAGNVGMTIQTLPIVTPVKNMVYSDGRNWVPLAVQSPPPTLTAEIGWIGLGFTSSQPVPPGTPTVVGLTTDYGSTFPASTSFTPDITGPSYGFVINTAGIYKISYQLFMTATSLTVGGDQVNYQSNIQYPGGILGLQQLAYDLVYGPFTIGGTAGVILSGSIIVPLAASNSNVTLNVTHNSAGPESIIGPITGPFIGAPDAYYSYMQIERLDSPIV